MQPPDRGPHQSTLSKTGTPYLSIVVPTPGPASSDSTARTQLFVDSWTNQVQRYRLECELIIAAQDPPALRIAQDCAPCQIRVLQAPREIRRHPPDQRMLTNAGIRRSRGEFILATGIDIIFSNELLEFLSAQRLEHGRMYRANRYDVALPVPTTSPEHRLVHCQSHAIRVHAREGVFELTPAGLRRNAPGDVASANSTVSFGSGWFPPERYAPTGETFRWIGDHAEMLTQVPPGGGILMLEVEPGPGLGALPQPLQILDSLGSAVAEAAITGRTTLVISVPPAAPGALRKFCLHLPGGGAPVLDDPRILNLAVFRCDWCAPNIAPSLQASLSASIREHSSILKRLLGSLRKYRGIVPLLLHGAALAARSARLLSRRGNDIFQGGMDFALDRGWYYREESGGERFRWVSKDANLLVRMPEATSKLAMLAEPGPGGAPAVLVVRFGGERGEVLARVALEGLTYFEFTVPAAPGTIAPLYFTPEKPGAPAGSDSRSLSFRVFACGAAPRASVSRNSGRWLILPIDSRPVTKDWTSRREASPQRIEMGRPAFLHTTTCTGFTLMSRAHWLDVRGFPELDLPTAHLDSIFCYAAHHSGAQEQILEDPLRIYCTAPDQPPANASPQWTTALHDDLLWLIAHMRSFHSPVIFNRAGWGLANQNLTETVYPTGNAAALTRNSPGSSSAC